MLNWMSQPCPQSFWRIAVIPISFEIAHGQITKWHDIIQGRMHCAPVVFDLAALRQVSGPAPGAVKKGVWM
jgi:hypothetical protein